ncbi:hypothetical protein DES53_1268 [Roseimicrobium gellanilyticum]|uniref:Uncharacterized protein n=1 Tax=Roseimicrobium gellanilyticum TaxID=748857 RepID=A0A366H1N6_9BACT|nr:hypothetical protein [Roseimicrobium gellanilyticum]RBP35132.1 hypothetical protein DES53_1268 [Roseimicrobium gellanilyticum]
MRNLADALIEAITYISIAPGDDDRSHADVQALESLVATLRDSSPEELEALRAALNRARAAAKASGDPSHDLEGTFRAIEENILETGDE